MIASSLLEVLPLSIRIIRRLAADCLDGSVTVHHLGILHLVREGKGQAEMAQHLQVTPAAISKMILSLTKRNLLIKTPGKDKRSLNLSLTSEGGAILKSVSRELEKKINHALRSLTPAESDHLEKGLGSLSKLMNKLNEEIK